MFVMASEKKQAAISESIKTNKKGKNTDSFYCII